MCVWRRDGRRDRESGRLRWIPAWTPGPGVVARAGTEEASSALGLELPSEAVASESMATPGGGD